MMKLSGLVSISVLLVAPLLGWAAAPETLGQQAKAILQTHCASCHGGGKASKGGFGFVLDRDLLLRRSLLVPGQAAQSELFQRVQQGEMPPPSRPERPSPAELHLLKRWIDAGAPAFTPSSQTVRKIPERDVAGIILADLESSEPRQRRFLRYLTLTHLAAAGQSETTLQLTRAAAGKLLNSLSWHPRLSLPEVLADGLILRLDLRAYKWTAALWEKLVSAYPYRFEITSEQGRLFTATAGTELPALRADWFVATASQPPLYHDLLQLPQTDRALERVLQVDVPGNIQDDNVLRAGFNDSGVSKKNRLIERHDAAHGAFWRSYDFARNTGRQNLFEHPLGPNTGATSFQPDGGEMIFHLPNGLFGYLLADAQGRRIDRAPGEIVADPRRPDQRVVTGLSCMSCHARGLLPKGDQVRGHVEKNAQVFGQQIAAAVRALHPRRSQFEARIREDNLRYLQALEPFGVRDPDQEPVNLVTQRFEATMDGRTAAAELGQTLEEFEKFVKSDLTLARTFGTLLVPGGTVQRQVFEEQFPALTRRLGAKPLAAFAHPPEKRERGLDAFKGHTGTVNCVVFAPDGQRVASGSSTGTVRLWAVVTGKELATLPGEGQVLAVAFAQDGRWLLSASSDRRLRLWDVSLRKGVRPVRLFQGHTAAVRCVAFAPDGKRAASGGDDGSLRIWDVARGTELQALVGHTQSVTSLAWSGDGRHILSGSRDGTLRWWEPTQAKQLRQLEGHAGTVLSVALAADGKTAFSGGNDRTVRQWDLATGQEVHCFQGHANAVIQVHVLPGDKAVLSSSSQHLNPDRTWRRWDPGLRQEVNALSAGAEIRFGCAAFSPDGRQILAGGPGGLLRIWNW